MNVYFSHNNGSEGFCVFCYVVILSELLIAKTTILKVLLIMKLLILCIRIWELWFWKPGVFFFFFCAWGFVLAFWKACWLVKSLGFFLSFFPYFVLFANAWFFCKNGMSGARAKESPERLKVYKGFSNFDILMRRWSRI